MPLNFEEERGWEPWIEAGVVLIAEGAIAVVPLAILVRIVEESRWAANSSKTTTRMTEGLVFDLTHYAEY